ncbi:class I SAM-dependent methyltransferase [Paracoccus binzhouensis]|uniref:class I SAM-dependent methyltransferase n=1 Tax=Paracoccus binzhouensis TaxID=2796149 RepID=UPI0018EF1FAF|nr:class I SAM-dependent methyltransferase [Paracoccus binzhouensis]
MPALEALIETKLQQLSVPLGVRLPSGKRLGPPAAPVTLAFDHMSGLAQLAAGRLGRLGDEIVAGRARVEGSMRDLMQVVAALTPAEGQAIRPSLWQRLKNRVHSALHHSRERDAEQIRSHYDVSNEFYALWLDPLRVYSCAYFRDPQMSLAQAQEAKLDLICRKLDLRPGERFVDIGAGWGGLLMHAARHYGVDATGITLSRNQFEHVSRLIEAEGLGERVRIRLCDYRDLQPEQPFDKLASVGMFEHVGRANMLTYCETLRRLLKPGGMALNHGITAAGLDDAMVGGGLGDFIEKHIFPGGELIHVSHAIRTLSQAGLEMVDTENLRPHYARTLWCWSDALESQLPQAEQTLARSMPPSRAAEILRAYRLYLAGCAMAFERGWVALHQILLINPDPARGSEDMPGAHSGYPFRRDYIYR